MPSSITTMSDYNEIVAVNADARDADAAALSAPLDTVGALVVAMTEDVDVVEVDDVDDMSLGVAAPTIADEVAEVERAVPVATLIVLPETVSVPPIGAVLNGMTKTVTVTVLALGSVPMGVMEVGSVVMAVGSVVLAVAEDVELATVAETEAPVADVVDVTEAVEDVVKDSS